MALLQIRRGNNGTKGTLQYGEPFFNSQLQTVQFGANGSEEITLVKLNTGLAGVNTWGSSSIYENSGSLSVTGDITASNAYLRGNLVVSGNIILGNLVSGQTTSSDSITVVADFTSNLVPNESSSYNLGAVSRSWANVYTDNLTLTALSGLDAENNIVYVNSSNALTASNDFEFIPGNKVRIGQGSVDKFTVGTYTGNTFISGNLEVHGNTGIFVSGNVSSSGGQLFAVSGTFANLNPNAGGADNGLVFTQGGKLVNNSNIRFYDGQQQLNISNNNFTVDGINNGNVFTSGTLHALGQFSGSSAVLTQTLQVDGATNLYNQLSLIGANGRIVVNKDVVIGDGLYVTGGIDSSGDVRLNAGNVGTTQIRGKLFIGSSSIDGETSISGTFSQEYSGSALEVLHKRISPARNASIIFDDDTNPTIGGLPGRVILRNQSTDGLLDSQIAAGVTSSGITVSTGANVGTINIGYTNPGTGSTIRVNVSAPNGIGLNSRTQISSNLSVTGSTILGRDNDDLLTIASPTTMSGDVWNQGYIAYLGNLKVSESLEVSGSTTLLGRLKIGDLVTSASGLIEGSASIAGDLTVRGNAVYLGVDRLSTDANLLELASGSTAGFEAEGAGLYVSTSLLGGNASIRYTTTGSSERFIINKGVYIIGDPNDGYGLQISNNTHITGNLDVDGNLSVDGTITLVNANITKAAVNTLNVTASAAITGNLEVNGNLSVTGSTNLGDAAGDNVQIPGTLNVSGAVKNGSTLNVVGAVGFNNVLRVTGSTAISGGLFVSGNTILSSSLTVVSSSFFEKNLRVSGNLQVDGNVDILGEVVNVNVSNLMIEDKNVIIARGSLSSIQSNEAGFQIEGPTTSIQFTWDHANQRMNLNKNFNVSGSLLVQGDDIIDTAVALAIALG